MPQQRWIEVFSIGCPLCKDAIDLVEPLSGNPDQVIVHDMNTPAVIAEAYRLGIRSVPTILIDGQIAECCAGGVNEAGLRAALGLPLD